MSYEKRQSIYVTNEQFNKMLELQAAYIGKTKTVINKTKFLTVMIDMAKKEIDGM
jgi:hypothetical protein